MTCAHIAGLGRYILVHGYQIDIFSPCSAWVGGGCCLQMMFVTVGGIGCAQESGNGCCWVCGWGVIVCVVLVHEIYGHYG